MKTYAFVKNLPLVVLDGMDQRIVGVEQHVYFPGECEQISRILFRLEGNMVTLAVEPYCQTGITLDRANEKEPQVRRASRGKRSSTKANESVPPRKQKTRTSH